MKRNNRSGFTLIELLIVIAIIGILAAIAIPAYLGQREKAKARAVESSAKGSVAELQSWLDSFVCGEPFVGLDVNGTETCFESTSPDPGKSCAAKYSSVSNVSSYDPSNIGSLLTISINHHAGLDERSPYNLTQSLFVDTVTEGSIVLTSIGTRSIRIRAFTMTTGSPIFDTTVMVF